MRKVLSGILAAVIVLSVCATTALAAGPGRGRYFVDADGDGICDNCGVYHRCGMAATSRGRNFVDADGDGVCDYYVTGQGRGNGRGNGVQGGCGRNFVDTNGDGVCDNYASSQGCGGYGFRSARGR